jgi:hypothetical protein
LRKLAVLAGLLLLAPFVAVPQWSRTAINGEQTCVRDSGERFDVPADSRSWVTFGCNVLNSVETYLGVSLPKAFAQARIDPTTGDGLNVENGNAPGPIWRAENLPSLISFEEGTGGTFDFAPYCYSPSGAAKTFSTDTSLPSGVTFASNGTLTVSTMANDGSFNLEPECDVAGQNAAVVAPVTIQATTAEYRVMGLGPYPPGTAVNVTINEAQTYQLVVGRADTLFEAPYTFFMEQWTADFDGSGCNSIDTTYTLEAYSGSGTTLGTGYDYYVYDPPDIAMDCTQTFTLSNFVNDTSAMDTVAGKTGMTTATINVIADEAPGSSVYFSNISGWTPPTLSTPLTVTTKAGLAAYIVTAPAVGTLTASGSVYEIGNAGGDILIDLSG